MCSVCQNRSLPNLCDNCSTHLMAYCRVFTVSSVDVGSAVMHAIMQVWALPPMESCRPQLQSCSLSEGPDKTLEARPHRLGRKTPHHDLTQNTASWPQKVQHRSQSAVHERTDSQKQLMSQA